MESLATNNNGLSSSEARARLAKYGYNELKFKKRGPLIRFLSQFKSPLIYVLIAAASVTAFLNMWLDTAVIMAVVFANAIIGFIQEGRAEASMEAVTRMMVPVCTVLRDGEQKEIEARGLVPERSRANLEAESSTGGPALYGFQRHFCCTGLGTRNSGGNRGRNRDGQNCQAHERDTPGYRRSSDEEISGVH
jgi:hypothetical protein